MKKIMFLLSAALCPLLSQATPAEVKASSFGFNPDNATTCLQKAIDSGAKKVIVDNTGAPWIIAPVKLRSNLELVFADKVQVKALKGSYKDKIDCMFHGSNVENVTMRGEGTAVLEMHKKDYQKQPDYRFSEWRHCISFRGSSNIIIRDLTLKSSGGDGIYISNSSKNGPCRKVLIENIISDDHHRQGISIISAVDLLVRNCKFINTSGTAPQCGIDIEPNNSKDMLVNNVVENCEFYGNAAGGVSIFLPYLSTPVSIVIRNCKVYNNSYGMRTNSRPGPKGEIQQGSILFENCQVYGNRTSPLTIAGQQKNGMTVTVRSCTLDHRKGSGAVMTFNNARVGSNMTGVFFENCTVYPGENPMFTVVKRSGYGIEDIKGDVKVIYDNGKVSNIDWDKLRKQHPEDKEQQSFDFAEIEFEKLRPQNGAVSKSKPQTWRFRGSTTCLLYTDKAGEFDVNFKVTPLRPNRKFNYQVVVKLANNTLVEKFNVDKLNYTRKFKSNGKKLFILEIRRSSQTIDVSADCAGFGFLVQNRVALFRAITKNMYFYVQPGVKEFKIEVMGTGTGEWVTAALCNAQGKVVASCRQNPGAVLLRGVREDASKGEVWKLQLRGKEDHTLRFSAPLIPVVSPSAEQVFHYADK